MGDDGCQRNLDGPLRAVFFFSSRRRHTRLVSDWSSDVCSSDSLLLDRLIFVETPEKQRIVTSYEGELVLKAPAHGEGGGGKLSVRSEERRVGKEWRSRLSP